MLAPFGIDFYCLFMTMRDGEKMSQEVGWSKDLNAEKFQELYEQMLKKKYYPLTIRGGWLCNGDLSFDVYSAIFVPFPKTPHFSVQSHYGLTQPDFTSRHGTYLSQGYTLLDKRSFLNARNEELYCCVWEKR